MKDHPRMRGVHPCGWGYGGQNVGSSPHARGPLDLSSGGDLTSRIIPACAGSTCSRRPQGAGSEDHPRMRGVHLAPWPSRWPPPGSSPHARGPRPLCRNISLQWRIIPACAGSTQAIPSWSRKSRDHPRMRGVHWETIGKPLMILGSSPHARGPPRIKTCHRKVDGIIPACAGSTQAIWDKIKSIRIIPACAGSTAWASRSCILS